MFYPVHVIYSFYGFKQEPVNVHHDGSFDVHTARCKSKRGIIPGHDLKKCLFAFQIFCYCVNHQSVLNENLAFIVPTINGERAGFIGGV